ncbi:Uncharacterised protein [Serratia plymuthica]|jgi:hypothetical protein|nr:putative membrane protein [Serratia plymuthica A30]CAI1166382.1 Uncharacterised protein [Serratia plymuthica]
MFAKWDIQGLHQVIDWLWYFGPFSIITVIIGVDIYLWRVDFYRK